MTEIYTVLANDPGSRNYGYAVVSFRLNNGKIEYKVRETGMMQHLVTEMKDDLKGQIKRHVAETRRIIKRWKVTHYVVERFQTRGNGGNLIELISAMIGANVQVMRQPSLVITAATWKNRVNAYDKGRQVLGKKGKPMTKLEKLYVGSKVAPHEIDATCMTFYNAVKLFDNEPAVMRLVDKRLIKQVESCSTSEPILPKPKRKPKSRKKK